MHTSNTVISTLEANLMLHCQPTFSFFTYFIIIFQNLTILLWRLSVLNTQSTFCSTELKIYTGCLWMISFVNDRV